MLHCLFKMGKHKKENCWRYVKETKWRIREKKRLEAQEAGCSNSAGTRTDSAGYSDSADPQKNMQDELWQISYPVNNTAYMG